MISTKGLLWVLIQWLFFLIVDTRSASFLPRKGIHHVASMIQKPSSTLVILRGGSTMATDESDEEDDKEESVKEEKEEDDSETVMDPTLSKLQAYRMKQQMLMQLRATYLSEALAKRGLPIPSISDVETPEGSTRPQPVDWDCALTTKENPLSCLYTFDAEPNTKLVAPLDTDKWMTLGSLNRLRRTDPTKVESMWNFKYTILQSWFDPESEYSLLQHVGIQGLLLNSVIEGLPFFLGLSLMVAAIVCMPILEYIVNRFLVSSFLWSRWQQWSRWVHAALPLKLLLGQMAFKAVARGFGELLGIVKDRLVEIECDILEQNIPLTVGVPTLTPDSDGDAGSNVEDDWDLDKVDIVESSTDEDDYEELDDEE